MVPMLKKLNVWTLHVHIVAQINHRGLGVKVETNCLRASDLTPRHSFLSTTFSIFIYSVLKFMCTPVYVLWWLIKPILALNCLNANYESDDSGDALYISERYISFKIKTYCHFCLIVQASLI